MAPPAISNRLVPSPYASGIPRKRFTLSTNIVFTDDPLVAGTTTIKAVHLVELRTAINVIRSAAGLAGATITNSMPAGVPIKAVHITELRSALNEARVALGLPALASYYTDAVLTSGVTPVKAVHLQQLRDASRVVVVVCPVIAVVNPARAIFTMGAPMSQVFTQSGAILGTTFSLVAGAMPSGLTLGANGTLSGTPGQTGPFPITVGVTDGNGCTGTSATYTLTIVAAPLIASFVASPGQLAPGASALLTPTFLGGTGLITNNQNTSSIAAISGVAASVVPPADTIYILTVTNLAGDNVSSITSVLLKQPSIVSFTGPSFWTTGKPGTIVLTGVYPTANASAIPVVTISGGGTCPAGITTNKTYTLTVGVMQAGRTQATATLLGNGKVLIAGGTGGTFPTFPLNTAELFTFNSGFPAFSSTAVAVAGTNLSIARSGHSAIQLSNGGILFAGGTNGTSCGTTAQNCNMDAYDPLQDTFGLAGIAANGSRTLTFGILLPGNRMIFGGGTTTATPADFLIP